MAFGAILLLIACFGVFAINLLGRMAYLIEDSHEWTEGLLQVNEIFDNASKVQRAILLYPMSGASDKASFKRTREEAAEAAFRIIRQYRSEVLEITYDSEEDMQSDLDAIDLIDAKLEAFLEHADRSMLLTDSGRTAEAEEHARGDLHTSYTEFNDAVNELATYSADQALLSGKEGRMLYARSIRFVVGLMIGVLAISIAITLLMSNAIRKSVKKLMKATEAARDGDLTVRSDVRRGDEFGLISRDCDSMLDSISELICSVKSSANDIASSSNALRDSIASLDSGTKQIADNVEHVSSAANDQSGNVENTSESMSRVASEISTACETIEGSSAAAMEAVDKARDGEAAMKRAIDRMGVIEHTVDSSAKVVITLGERSVEIGEIVGVISGIATQTNLLALNAAIEAARAGEHGRGFSVVAEQVKKLAGESQAAAEKITELVATIRSETEQAVSSMHRGQTEVSEGSEAIEACGQAFSDLAAMSVANADKMKESVELMRDLVDSAQKTLASSEGILDASRRISNDSQTIVAATEEQSASTNEISSAAQKLAEISNALLDAADKFKL